MYRTTDAAATLTAGCQWTNWTDEELLQEYRYTNNREAFAEIVRRYERELFGYLYHHLGSNVANAEDVCQKTFLALLQECDKFEAGRKFRPWLYRIATNKVFDHKRQARLHGTISIGAPVGDGADTYRIADAVAGNEPEPFEDPMDREIAQKVRDAVQALPAQLRQVVYMVYFQGLTYREAANAAGTPYSTVSSRLEKAVRKLNFLLKNVG
jgi:RNA polymerase sigma-70 factor (ECF subfamily)